jgi:hypothetical protein
MLIEHLWRQYHLHGWFKKECRRSVYLSCVIHAKENIYFLQKKCWFQPKKNQIQLKLRSVIHWYIILHYNSIAGSIQKLGTTSSMNVAMSPSGSLTLDLALGESCRELKQDMRREEKKREEKRRGEKRRGEGRREEKRRGEGWSEENRRGDVI